MPPDVPVDVEPLREWAIGRGLVASEEQFINPSLVEDLSKVFSTEDDLSLVMDFHKDSGGVAVRLGGY